MRERLNDVISYTGNTVNSFSKKLGMSQSSLFTYLNGKTNSIASTYLENLHKEYPQIDLHWVITGEGEMLRKLGEQKQKTYKILPLLDQIAEIIREL